MDYNILNGLSAWLNGFIRGTKNKEIKTKLRSDS